jgi:putative glycosyltransferase (TIGR04372 family)
MRSYKPEFLDNPHAQRWIGLGERPDAPFRILAPLVGRDGPSLEGVVRAAQDMASQFRYSETTFVVDPAEFDPQRISETHSRPAKVFAPADAEALGETLNQLLYDDFDFIFPGDQPGSECDARRWDGEIGLTMASLGAFSWPPSSWGTNGSDERRPFRIIAPLHLVSFGDFLAQIYFVSKLAAKFKHSETIFIIHDIYPYHTDLIKYYPYQCKAVAVPNNAVFKKYLGEVYASGADFIIPTAYSCDKLPGNFGDGHLIVPTEGRTEIDHALSGYGLDPDRWFCCVHFRQPNYEYKPYSNCRDVDPSPYLASIDYVVDELGGQVVLLGHPEISTRPNRDGFVDLSRLHDSHDLQFGAVARSRFLYCTSSGACSFANSTGVPMGLIDAADFWNVENTAIMTHTLVETSGRKLRQREYFESGWMNTKKTDELLASDSGFSLIKRDAADIRRMIDYMVSATTDTEGWRPYREPESEASGQFKWPVPISLDHNFI